MPGKKSLQKWETKWQTMFLDSKKFVRPTEPSNQNESSDSVSPKPLDGFKNGFKTKRIFIFDGRFVTTIIPKYIAQLYGFVHYHTSPFLITNFIERLRRGRFCPFVPLLPFFSSLSFWGNKMEEQKGHKTMDWHGKWKKWRLFTKKQVILLLL